jgi:hypothetical protein
MEDDELRPFPAADPDRDVSVGALVLVVIALSMLGTLFLEIMLGCTWTTRYVVIGLAILLIGASWVADRYGEKNPQ